MLKSFSHKKGERMRDDVCKRCGYVGKRNDTYGERECPNCGLYHWWAAYPTVVPMTIWRSEYEMITEASRLKEESEKANWRK